MRATASHGTALSLPRRAPAARRAALLLVTFGAASGCAAWRGGRETALSERSSSAESGAKVWSLLVAGDDRAAEAAAAAAPRDRFTLLADASLAFERGDGPRAISSYLALLEVAGAGPGLDPAGSD
ncbi:MAG TPA: hypothetical protein VIU64_12760, partial [Polyangia bacterium]